MHYGQVLIVFGTTLVLAVLLVGASLAYARRRGVLDRPGNRSSHSTPTPRGGGLGLLLAAMPALLWGWYLWLPQPTLVGALWLALLALMGVGWLDDHRSLPGWPRLAVHLLAAALLAAVVVAGLPGWPLTWRLAGGLALLLAAAWSTNAHNFMDGIDALLGMQACFYFAALGGFAWALSAPGVALACAGVAAACLGFLHYNRPPARLFMGDVGSAALGWLVACVAALLWRQASVGLWLALILASGFVVDATATLLWRIGSGQRWYTAHREHAYQWLVRSGLGHGRVVLLYLAWNLLVALPAALATVRWPQFGPWLLAAVSLLGVLACVAVRHFGNPLHERRRHGAA